MYAGSRRDGGEGVVGWTEQVQAAVGGAYPYLVAVAEHAADGFSRRSFAEAGIEVRIGTDVYPVERHQPVSVHPQQDIAVLVGACQVDFVARQGELSTSLFVLEQPGLPGFGLQHTHTLQLGGDNQVTVAFGERLQLVGR